MTTAQGEEHSSGFPNACYKILLWNEFNRWWRRWWLSWWRWWWSYMWRWRATPGWEAALWLSCQVTIGRHLHSDRSDRAPPSCIGRLRPAGKKIGWTQRRVDQFNMYIWIRQRGESAAPPPPLRCQRPALIIISKHFSPFEASNSCLSSMPANSSRAKHNHHKDLDFIEKVENLQYTGWHWPWQITGMFRDMAVDCPTLLIC